MGDVAFATEETDFPKDVNSALSGVFLGVKTPAVSITLPKEFIMAQEEKIKITIKKRTTVFTVFFFMNDVILL